MIRISLLIGVLFIIGCNADSPDARRLAICNESKVKIAAWIKSNYKDVATIETDGALLNFTESVTPCPSCKIVSTSQSSNRFGFLIIESQSSESDRFLVVCASNIPPKFHIKLTPKEYVNFIFANSAGSSLHYPHFSLCLIDQDGRLHDFTRDVFASPEVLLKTIGELLSEKS